MTGSPYQVICVTHQLVVVEEGAEVEGYHQVALLRQEKWEVAESTEASSVLEAELLLWCKLEKAEVYWL